MTMKTVRVQNRIIEHRFMIGNGFFRQISMTIQSLNEK